MTRALHVSAEVAAALPASHLAQLQQDVAASDNVCVVCAALIEGDAAELVVLHDARVMLARLAHPECAVSAMYEWEGTSEAVAALTLRPDGIEVATALAWRGDGRPRALVLVEPRIHISLDDADRDPLARLFAEPLGLAPASGSLARLAPAPAPGVTATPGAGGLSVGGERLRISVPADAATLAAWRAHVDDGHAILLLGRGLGITGAESELATRVAEALALRPCWAATIAVVGGEAR